MKHSHNNPASQQSLLTICDQPGFARDVVARWQMEPQVPEFTVMSSDLWAAAGEWRFDLAIAGDVKTDRTGEILGMLNEWPGPSIYIAAAGQSVHVLRREYSRLIVVPRHDAWIDTLVLLANEVLRRSELNNRLLRIEQTARNDHKYAILGQYVLETRHNFNNALTSVLGNAELLLLDSAEMTPSMREQLETVHEMTLRLHEMMLRFTSLEAEMQFSDRSQTETLSTRHAASAAAGSQI
jgi:signal transduction histidine kinase